MKREGCVCIMACTKSLENVNEKRKYNYNAQIYTNKTLKHPFAHGRVGRAHCSLCTHPEKSGKYKRKQLKHEINQIRKTL
jgi:hypothetical protein